MKALKPAVFDFRMQITSQIDVVLSAKAKALGIDKMAVARDILARWAAAEMLFAQILETEANTTEHREARQIFRRRPLNRRQTNAVFARDGFVCRECKDEPGVEHLHIDHIIPIAAGGTNDLSNLRVLCARCNLEKSDKIVAIKGSAA